MSYTQIFFGGPMHDTKQESENEASEVLFVRGRDKEHTIELARLTGIGIAPPIGTPTYKYTAVARWEDAFLYVFVGGVGEIYSED